MRYIARLMIGDLYIEFKDMFKAWDFLKKSGIIYDWNLFRKDWKEITRSLGVKEIIDIYESRKKFEEGLFTKTEKDIPTKYQYLMTARVVDIETGEEYDYYYSIWKDRRMSKAELLAESERLFFDEEKYKNRFMPLGYKVDRLIKK